MIGVLSSVDPNSYHNPNNYPNINPTLTIIIIQKTYLDPNPLPTLPNHNPYSDPNPNPDPSHTPTNPPN